MIISASRRTDIPAFHSEWFFGRIKEKRVEVKNPFNANQKREINLEPNAVDCFVFWSKNPKPMLDKLDLIKEYNYYFQFTLNPYGRDIEVRLPPKNEIIETFKKVSDKIGVDRIIWRYDPVLFNDKYNTAYHIEKFDELAAALKGYTEKATFSFIDFYKKILKNLQSINAEEITHEEKITLAKNFSQIAEKNNFAIGVCAEDIDLAEYGITNARCIDAGLISKITGREITGKKDKNQRPECGCIGSVDIGQYNSCSNGCIYCYANYI